jgi:hypothetical protein
MDVDAQYFSPFLLNFYLLSYYTHLHLFFIILIIIIDKKENVKNVDIIIMKILIILN